jgi:hypothetical protein
MIECNLLTDSLIATLEILLIVFIASIIKEVWF